MDVNSIIDAVQAQKVPTRPDVLHRLANDTYLKVKADGACTPEQEAIMRSNPATAVLCAKNVVCGPWEEAEDTIAKDGKASLEYARDVLDGPFPKGEAAIAKDQLDAYEYALCVLRGPFPKGEDIIAKNAFTAHNYAYLIKRRFPKGEKAILARGEDDVEAYADFLREYDLDGYVSFCAENGLRIDL